MIFLFPSLIVPLIGVFVSKCALHGAIPFLLLGSCALHLKIAFHVLSSQVDVLLHLVDDLYVFMENTFSTSVFYRKEGVRTASEGNATLNPPHVNNTFIATQSCQMFLFWIHQQQCDQTTKPPMRAGVHLSNYPSK